MIRDCSKREQRLIYEISFVVKCAAGIPGQGQGRARRARGPGSPPAGEDEAAKEARAFLVYVPTDCV